MMTGGLTCFLALLIAAPDNITVRRLTLHPAAAPVPALRYLLLPDLENQTPGNAVLFYDRAMVLLSEQRPPADLGEQLHRWLEMPLRELPLSEAGEQKPGTGPKKNPSPRRYLTAYAGVLHELSLGARCRHCDWQLDFRTEGIGLLLPEVQRMRSLIQLVALQARVLVAEGHLNEALSWVQTGFAMARHTGEGPTLIQSLVGIAMAHLMCDQLEELMQQPGAPNLYWSLTHLPRPLVDLRTAIEGEKTLFLKNVLPSLPELETVPLTAEQARQRFTKLLQTLDESDGTPKRDLQLAALFITAKFYPMAKHYLVQQGLPAERVEAMAPLQVVVIYSLRQYYRARDDMFKWMTLPYWQAGPGLHKALDQLKQMRAEMQEGLPIASLLLPAADKVVSSAARSERRLALLRTIEALRLHAAEHRGQLPATLQALAPLPVPTDPVTGKPFEYHVEGDRATLFAPPPPGEMPAPHNAIRYELTIHR